MEVCAGTYGNLVSQTARLHPHGGQYDLSMAVGEMLPALRREAAKPGKDFGTLVRERRRKWGLPLPVQDKILPFCSTPQKAASVISDEGMPLSVPESLLSTQSTIASEDTASPMTPLPCESDSPPGDALGSTQAMQRLKLAEQRLQAVLNELEMASLRGASTQKLRRWEQAYRGEMQAYEAAALVVEAQQTSPAPHHGQ